MARENKILKTLKMQPAPNKEAADPEFDKYLEKINRWGNIM